MNLMTMNAIKVMAIIKAHHKSFSYTVNQNAEKGNQKREKKTKIIGE